MGIIILASCHFGILCGQWRTPYSRSNFALTFCHFR